MLDSKQRDLILEAFEKNMKKAGLAKGLLPVDKSIMEKSFPGPGLHAHTDDNPLGLHKHHDGEEMTGAHVHSPQNPTGEHSHGESKGMALITGRHFHDHDGLGWHNHPEDDDENLGKIPIEKPAQELPQTNPEQPKSE